jgi:hypothetical protein
MPLASIRSKDRENTGGGGTADSRGLSGGAGGFWLLQEKKARRRKNGTKPFFITSEAVPKLQFLEQLLTPWRKLHLCNSLYSKELAIFSKSLFQNQPGFGTSSSINIGIFHTILGFIIRREPGR